MKRLFDLSVSLLVVLVSIPLWTLTAVLIRLESDGPVFYRGVRIGRKEEPFRIFKFRTMVADADRLGRAITREHDPRITKVGRVLRRLKIDEMPQLLNVILGQMSIVGPRPEDPRYVAGYGPEEKRVLSVRPGMASPAFIKYRHEETVLAAAGEDMDRVYREEILPDKLRMDLEYVENRSFLYDLRIFLRAGLSLFRRPPDSGGSPSFAPRDPGGLT